MLAGPAWVSTNTDWQGAAREEVVFMWPDGRMINPDRISDWYHGHREAAGLPRIRLHDLRHTYATAALENARGWHEVKVISERLGHASVGITVDTYAHVLPTADRETADTLASLILGNP
jgi:integrase